MAADCQNNEKEWWTCILVHNHLPWPDKSSSLWKIVHRINMSSSGMSTEDRKERQRISGLVKTEGHGQLMNVLKVLNI